jgi:NAD(P)-dependent dehydrogenase (short-subunit alcohol dehydrogenase family)
VARRRVSPKAVETFGRLDIVVNNAGIVRHQMIEDISEEDFDVTIAASLKGTFAICARSPVNRASGYGRIINTASNQWAAPLGNADDAASKGRGHQPYLRPRLRAAHDGIAVSTIAPFALTRMTADAGERDANVKEARTDPAKAAPMVVYLASEAAAGISGRVFRVGGNQVGLYCHPTEVRTIFRDESTGSVAVRGARVPPVPDGPLQR